MKNWMIVSLMIGSMCAGAAMDRTAMILQQETSPACIRACQSNGCNAVPAYEDGNPLSPTQVENPVVENDQEAIDALIRRIDEHLGA